MITKIRSKRVELPPIFLVENEQDFKELPKGLPYIIGTKSELSFITLFLEFQILYKSCMKTGIPIKWLDCLKKIGYNISSIKNYTLCSGGVYGDGGNADRPEITIDEFVEDKYFVDFDTLSDLKVLPKWLEDIKASIQTNIIDEVQFDPLAFNKQLGLNIGYSGIKHNMKNLLILDVSGSIPRSIVVSITNLAKLMSKKFYADVLITSGKSVLIDYEDVPNSDIIEIARLSGSNNESTMYKQIISEHKEYNTVISFGDDDCPGVDKEDKLCNFKLETLYSLHTESTTSKVTGYAKCFDPKKTTHIVKNWINTIN